MGMAPMLLLLLEVSHGPKPHNVSYKAVSGHITFATAVCHNQ